MTSQKQNHPRTPGFRELLGEDAAGIILAPSPKRVRAFFGGEAVLDTRRAKLLYHDKPYPDYYIPKEDIREDLLEATDHTTECPARGEARYWNVSSGDGKAENAAWSYHQPPEDIPDISNLLSLDWKAMDAWFEEDEEVFVHPRDPYHRIDVRESASHVEVRLGDTVLADSRRPVLLFETGLPVRYYLPRLDVRTGLLEFRKKKTACPYKGVTAAYWRIGDLSSDEEDPSGDEQDLAWCYQRPLSGMEKIAGRIAFYNERVEIHVDGEPA